MTAPKLINSRIQQADYLRNVFAATPEAGTTIEDLLAEGYWVHVAQSLQVSDRIEVIPEDGVFFAELIVLNAMKTAVKVKVLRMIDLTGEPAGGQGAEASPFVIVWRGQRARFSVLRQEDKSIVKEGFASKVDAQQWLTAYELNSTE